MINFVHGAVMMGFFTAAIFFARFHRDTRDHIFAWFAVAFALLGIERLVIAGLGGQDRAEMSPAVYLIRCIAFVLIIIAVAGKNVVSKIEK